MKKTIVGAALMAAWMMSCKSVEQATAIDLSGEWSITSVGGKEISAGSDPFIGLDMAGHRLYGNAGCNRLLGSFEMDSIHPGAIRFAQVGATRMMCPDMETESKVLEALNKVTGYAETTDGVALTDAEGQTLMTLVKREAPAVSLNDLQNEWIITQVNGADLTDMEKTPFITLNLEEKRIHGNSGCNIVNGSFEQEADQANSLRFTGLISTMMACPNLDTERAILTALDQVRSFAAGPEEDTLIMLDENGQTLLNLMLNTGASLEE